MVTPTSSPPTARMLALPRLQATRSDPQPRASVLLPRSRPVRPEYRPWAACSRNPRGAAPRGQADPWSRARPCTSHAPQSPSAAGSAAPCHRQAPTASAGGSAAGALAPHRSGMTPDRRRSADRDHGELPCDAHVHLLQGPFAGTHIRHPPHMQLGGAAEAACVGHERAAGRSRRQGFYTCVDRAKRGSSEPVIGSEGSQGMPKGNRWISLVFHWRVLGSSLARGRRRDLFAELPAKGLQVGLHRPGVAQDEPGHEAEDRVGRDRACAAGQPFCHFSARRTCGGRGCPSPRRDIEFTAFAADPPPPRGERDCARDQQNARRQALLYPRLRTGPRSSPPRRPAETCPPR